jgi:hypothetical protein
VARGGIRDRRDDRFIVYSAADSYLRALAVGPGQHVSRGVIGVVLATLMAAR